MTRVGRIRTNTIKFVVGACTAVTMLLSGSNVALAVTYNLGAGTSLGVIDSKENVNDPAPGNLICFAATDVCNTKKDTFSGTYTGNHDINSASLWESANGGSIFSLTSATSTTGTWSQIWQGTANEKITHYAAVKASGDYHLIGYNLALITAALMPGDIITGDWSVGTIPRAMSHVNLYNSAPMAVAPIPAALPLFLTGLGLLGFIGRQRRRGDRATA